MLACWGVLLVTRGVVRRATAVLAVVASLGLVATVVVGFTSLQDQVVRGDARERGDERHPRHRADRVVLGGRGLRPSCWSSRASLAVAWCPAWPEMGSRYDAPGAADGPADDVPPEERSNLDLWKQLDEGRDPTA